MGEPILVLQNLSKYYTSAANVVMGLNNVSLSFSEGEFVAITGESGSGKSTLSHILCGILPYESGEMLYCGEPTSQFDGLDRERFRREAVSFVSQDYGILPGCSVLQNVVSALLLSGMEKKEAKAQALSILERVELRSLAGRKAAHLSSGQKQRLSIARALAKPSRILIADEPTGNLDGENSRQIVKLLGDAAKERLVIMVTHDYEEVEHIATRHIVLRDGIVVQDSNLLPAVSVPVQEEKPRKKQRLSAYVAALQLIAKPGWSALLLLFFALTAFGVFAFLGSFIVALDDTNTRIYDNSAFRNGDRNRVIAARPDGQPMEQTDLDAILLLPNVVSLEPYGYLADINYAYRQDVDYRYRYSMKPGTGGEIDKEFMEGVTFEKTEVFAKTLPIFSDNHDLLSAGRLPENLYEVIAAGSSDLLGTTMPVFIQNRQGWSTSAYIKLDVTVVGTTSEGTGLYFHPDLGRLILPTVQRAQAPLIAPWYEDDLEGKVLVSHEVYIHLKQSKHWDGYLHFGTAENPIDLEVVGFHDSPNQNYYLVSDAFFREMTDQSLHNQVSINLTDYAFANRTVEKLQSLGYISLSPFQQGSTKQNPTLAAQRMQTLKICLTAFSVCLILQIMVLKGMFSVQNENYRLLSNIGLLNTTARNSIHLQHLFLCVFGQLLGFGGILLCSRWGIRQIVQLVHYLPLEKALILSGIHFLGCGISSLLVCHDLSKKIFPYGSVFRDLPERSVDV